MIRKWMQAIESKGLKVNLLETKLMVKGWLDYEVYPCGIFGLRVKVNSVLCVQCCKWIHSRCAGVSRVISVVKESCLQEIFGMRWSRKISYVMK